MGGEVDAMVEVAPAAVVVAEVGAVAVGGVVIHRAIGASAPNVASTRGRSTVAILLWFPRL